MIIKQLENKVLKLSQFFTKDSFQFKYTSFLCGVESLKLFDITYSG